MLFVEDDHSSVMVHKRHLLPNASLDNFEAECSTVVNVVVVAVVVEAFVALQMDVIVVFDCV